MILFCYNLVFLVALFVLNALTYLDPSSISAPSFNIIPSSFYWLAVINRFFPLDLLLALVSFVVGWRVTRFLIRIVYDLWEAVPLN